MTISKRRGEGVDVEFLTQMLDSLPTPIYAKDAQSRFIFSNRSHDELIGRKEEELIGKTDADFYPAEAARGFLANDQQVILTGSTSIAEELANSKDGMTLPVLSRKARMIAPDGKAFLVGMNFDLSEVKKREEQYRALAETVPVGVVQFEESGEVSFANPLLLAIMGSTDAGLNLEQFAGKIGNPAGFPGEASRRECDMQDSRGQGMRLLVISSGWLYLSKSRKRSAIVSVVDISENAELKRINDEVSRLNQELAASMAQLRDAQEALVKKGRMEQMGQLTATIAHELRNPMGTIRTAAFVVERKLKDKGAGVEPQLQRINNGVTRCDAIISQLLDFSRTKKIHALPEDLDLWLVKVVEDESRRLPNALTITCMLGLEGRHVPFDRSRLQRALVNLIANAAEAMVGQGDKPLAPGNATPKIEVRTGIVGDWVEIAVTDNGPGMSPEVMARVREPLFTTKSFGTGLGVPAIEQIAMQHGGTLEITSELGAGACFSMRLPLQGLPVEEAA